MSILRNVCSTNETKGQVDVKATNQSQSGKRSEEYWPANKRW